MLDFINMVLFDISNVVVNDILDFFSLFEGVEKRRKQMWFEEDGLGASLYKRVFKTIFAEGIIGSDDGH